MANPMKTAVDSLFNRLGTSAMFKNRSVRIILNEPDEVIGVGFINAHSETHLARIRISDAPELKIGDKIETAEETLSVHTEPEKDIHKLIWSCDLECC